MIVVSINGGLANQMFQYAFSLYLKNKGLDVFLDQINFKPRACMTCETTKLQDVFMNVDIRNMPIGKFPLVWWKRRWNFLRKIAIIWGDKYIDEPSFKYYPNIYKKASKNCIFKGSWQCAKYFEDISDIVRNDFEFKPFTDIRNIKLEMKMQQENSIAIHVRKGKDYTTEFLLQNTCDLNYFRRAIQYIKLHVKSPVFYVFTDNPEWVKENLTMISYILVDWNPVSGKNNYLDMQLMSCAKHNIISNSTYSWWGAWLNRNKDKIVIGPSDWFNPQMKLKMYDGNQIIPDNWIKI